MCVRVFLFSLTNTTHKTNYLQKMCTSCSRFLAYWTPMKTTTITIKIASLKQMLLTKYKNEGRRSVLEPVLNQLLSIIIGVKSFGANSCHRHHQWQQRRSLSVTGMTLFQTSSRAVWSAVTIQQPPIFKCPLFCE